MKSYPITTMEELTDAAADSLAALRSRATDRAVLGLSGDLGAGKTTFVQTFAKLMGVTEHVTSPTFIIMKRYDTDAEPFRTLVHIDAYRIESVDELAVLGFSEIFAENDTMICIEWPERVGALMPNDATMLTFELSPDGQRTLSVSYAEEN